MKLWRVQQIGAAIAVTGLALSLGGCASTPADEPTETSWTSSGVIRSTEPWALGVHEGQMLTTDRFRLFSTDPAVWGSDRSAAFLEAAMSRLEAEFVLPVRTSQTKPSVYIVRSAREADLVARSLPNAAVNARREGLGGFVADSVMVVTVSPDRTLEPVLAHELWHLVVQSRFAEPLPDWLDEAIATAMEGHLRQPGRVSAVRFDPSHNPPRSRTLARLLESNEIRTLREYADGGFAEFGPDSLGFYAHAWALGAMLLDSPRYRDGLGRVVQAAAAGKLEELVPNARHDPEALLFEITGQEREDLELEYEDFLTWLARRD